MGYNITGVRVKTCTLTNTKKELATVGDIRYTENLQGDLYIDLCESSLSGVVKGDTIEITNFQHSGEGSGYAYDKLIEILHLTKGSLDAVLVWEGGDSISHLTVKDGKVITENL